MPLHIERCYAIASKKKKTGTFIASYLWKGDEKEEQEGEAGEKGLEVVWGGG